ncbi:MAG TPA: hypothetical protein VKB88_12655 [Bryobacteraceae bacterium]|nr:hypothetical protein [Bryobacteraceae bacterium]
MRLQISLLSVLLTVLPIFGAERGSVFAMEGPSVRVASNFPGADIGAQINAAYADLPSGGGAILLQTGGAFATPVVFGTKDKPVLLEGLPGDVVTLTYTATAGSAITFDYGTGHRMGHGLRDVTLTGPGNSSGTTGIVFGGNYGAEGLEFRDFKIQSFGTNLRMASHTWLAYFDHGMIRDGGINALLPSGLVEAGEQIVFDHVTFADAPPPHRDSVWVQGGGQEVVFTDCSFDQAQLHIGNGTVAGAQVVVKGSHFENPNFGWPDSKTYDYVVVDNHPGNLLRVTDSYFLQDAPTHGPTRFMAVQGGRLILCGVGMYTPAGSPLRNFASVGITATVDTYGFNDLSGNISGSLVGP